jgi:ATP-dependent RNA helicase DDX35
LGDVVGYSVQFDHQCDAMKTRIKYMTDGHLIRETMADPLLSRYSVIMLDEAHERSLQTDVLMGLLKKIRKKRSDLKLIISSATLDADAFRKFFQQRGTLNDVVIMGLEGRQFPVDIQYLEKPVVDYIETTIQTVRK